MNLGLIGYGKMGLEVEKIAKSRGHEISYIYDPGKKIESGNLDKVDALISFTEPTSVSSNIDQAIKAKKNIVIGTTGWNDKLPEITKKIKEAKLGFVYGPNFSVGVNTFFKIMAETTKIFNKLSFYDVYMSEEHHKFKKDAPSGTANKLADMVFKNIDRKKSVYNSFDRAPKEDELSIAVTRSGDIVGTHTLGFVSDVDELTFTHKAKNRGGFALGATLAAEWIAGKKGMYNFNNIFNEILEQSQ